MFTEGHKRLTIGSCCLAEYKKSVGGKTYKKYFPQLYDIPIPSKYGEKQPVIISITHITEVGAISPKEKSVGYTHTAQQRMSILCTPL